MTERKKLLVTPTGGVTGVATVRTDRGVEKLPMVSIDAFLSDADKLDDLQSVRLLFTQEHLALMHSLLCEAEDRLAQMQPPHTAN